MGERKSKDVKKCVESSSARLMHHARQRGSADGTDHCSLLEDMTATTTEPVTGAHGLKYKLHMRRRGLAKWRHRLMLCRFASTFFRSICIPFSPCCFAAASISPNQPTDAGASPSSPPTIANVLRGSRGNARHHRNGTKTNEIFTDGCTMANSSKADAQQVSSAPPPSPMFCILGLCCCCYRLIAFSFEGFAIINTGAHLCHKQFICCGWA